MHRGRCTLAPQDIQLYHRLSGDEDKFGIEAHSQEAKCMVPNSCVAVNYTLTG